MNFFIPEIIGEVELDFSKDTLYAWQEFYDPLVVKLMGMSLDKGIEIPPVNIVKKGDNLYDIAFFRNRFYLREGGHHRSQLGLLKGKLKCNIRESHSVGIKYFEVFPINEMMPITNGERERIFDWNRRFQRSLAYLPEEEARSFCLNHWLEPESWGIGYHGKTLKEILDGKK